MFTASFVKRKTCTIVTIYGSQDRVEYVLCSQLVLLKGTMIYHIIMAVDTPEYRVCSQLAWLKKETCTMTTIYGSQE